MRCIMVTAEVYSEGEYYVAHCVELGVSTFGSTQDEALARLEEATLLYLATLGDLGERGEVLASRGVPVRRGDASLARTRESLPDGATHSWVIPLDPPAA